MPAILSILLVSCLLGPQSKRGSVVDNEVRIGVIYASGGRPAANARIRVYPVGHVPDTLADSGSAPSGGAAFSTRTDNAGKFTVGTLPDGEYNILADQSGEYAIQDSVFLDANTAGIQPDTLAAPGSLSGTVRLQPNHDPRWAIVQVLGTNSYSNVDEQGRFRLQDLAGGRYTLRVSTSRSDYNTLFKSISISEGKADSLPEVLIPPFIGIPVVVGFNATFDTLNSVVKLSWDRVTYRDFSEYQVYRDTFPALEVSRRPIGATTDTFYLDSLGKMLKAHESANPEAPPLAFEYRIRVRNKSDSSGPSYGHINIRTPPPSFAGTQMTLRIERSRWDSTLQVDSFEVSATLGNPTRKLKSLTWAVGSKQDTLAVIPLGGVLESKQILRIGYPNEGAFTVFAEVEDEAGTIRLDSIRIPGNSAPSLSGTPDSVTHAFVPYRFAPVAIDPDKDTLRFSVLNLPKWCAFDSASGTLSGTPTQADTGMYTGILISAHDGRRTVKIPPFRIHILPNSWSPGPVFPGRAKNIISSDFNKRAYFVALDGRIYLSGKELWALDPQMGEWVNEGLNPIPGGSHPPLLVGLDGKIKRFGWGSGGVDTYSYDPIRKILESESREGYEGFNIQWGAVVDVTFYTFNARLRYVWTYDAALGSWSRKKDIPQSLDDIMPSYGGCAAAVGRKILYTALYDDDDPEGEGWIGYKSADKAFLYDLDSDSWMQVSSTLPRHDVGMATIGNKVYSVGGSTKDGMTNAVQEFDALSNTWKAKSPMPRTRPVLGAYEAGGKLFVFLDTYDPVTYTPGFETWIYDPALDP